MNRPDIVSQRLHNQKLSSSEFQIPVEVVRWLGAVQAQDFIAAKWALALRMCSATNAAIEEAYNKGQILRTHLLRPTWHFVAPEDIRWLLQLTAPRVNLRCGPNYRKFELDAASFKRTNKVLTKALQGGKYLTRSALKMALNQSGVAADDTVRLAHILIRAELDGIVCSGPRTGNQFTYALLEERVPAAKTLARDEALAKLTRRYFTSHGPATLQDFVWWSGLTAADAKHGIALVERYFEKSLLGDKVYWSPQSTQARPSHSAYVLPAYDEYFVSYKDRHTIFDQKNGKPLLTTWELLGPTVIINGTVFGRWKRSDERQSTTIELNLARKLKQTEKLALKRAVAEYEAFLGRPVQTVYRSSG